MTLKELERVLYFESYVIVDPGQTPLKKKEFVSETRYRKLMEEYGPGNVSCRDGGGGDSQAAP